MKKLLVLEDEEAIRAFVVLNLKRAGYEIIEAATGEEALEQYDKNPDLDIAVLDVMLPGISGVEVCKTLRASDKNIGIIMLTAKTMENDKVEGLMSGADDYIAKPFSPMELIVRVDSLFRRVRLLKGDNEDDGMVYGPIRLNTASRSLTKNGRTIEITQVEYQILKYFLSNPGVAKTREDISEAVWGASFDDDRHKIVDVNIRRLRMKLEDEPSNPVYIQTVWGYGYRWGK